MAWEMVEEMRNGKKNKQLEGETTGELEWEGNGKEKMIG